MDKAVIYVTNVHAHSHDLHSKLAAKKLKKEDKSFMHESFQIYAKTSE